MPHGLVGGEVEDDGGSARRLGNTKTCRPVVRAWEAAARAYGVDPEPRVRPNVGRWLLYVLWHQLPERHRIWVLYDATCATWVWRHFARIIAIVTLPTIAIAVFLPAPPALRVTTALVTGGLAVLFTGVWVNGSS